MWPALLLVLVVWIGQGSSATNYQDQAISIQYNSSLGLPTHGTLNGTVTELDDLAAAIKLNRTTAHLNCASGFMKIELEFLKDFYGIVYPDFDRNSPCKITGDGKLQEMIQIPLKGCGTLQKPARVFTNNIIVRFHPDLEIDGDEVITLVCRYPPPFAPPPIIPDLLQVPPPEVAHTLQPLREFEILLIICAIIFLALMLLGIGCSYYCLKKRNIKVVRRRPVSTLGSDVTKISEPVSLFGGLKIPRAQAQDESGSEEMVESINTDIHSDIQSVITEDEYTSSYSDKLCILPEGRIRSQLHEPARPGFDIQVAVTERSGGYFTPTPSVLSSDTDTMLQAQEQYLTTILERTETNTKELLERKLRMKQFSGPPPVHARISVTNAQITDQSEVDSTSEYSRAGTDAFSDQDIELETREVKSYSVIGSGGRNEQNDQSGSSWHLNDHVSSPHHTTANIYGTDHAGDHLATSHHTTSNVYRMDHSTDHLATSHHTTSNVFGVDRSDDYLPPSNVYGLDRSGDHLPSSNVYRLDRSGDHLPSANVYGVDRSGGRGDPTSSEWNSASYEWQNQMATSHHQSSSDVYRSQRTDHIGLMDADTAIRPTINTTHENMQNNFDVLIRIIDNDERYAQSEAGSTSSSIFTVKERTKLKEVLMEDIGVRRRLENTNHRQEVIQIWNESEELRQFIPSEKWDVVIRILETQGDDFSLPEGAPSVSTLNSTDLIENEVSMGARSVADRSATEITEYHHAYSQKMQWTDDMQ